MKRAGSQLLFIMGLMLVLLPCQGWADVALKVNKTDASSFPMVNVYLIVQKDGKVVEGLKDTDFIVKVSDGKNAAPKKVQSLRQAGEKVAVVLAVDTSGSMKGKPLEEIKVGLMSLIRQKGPEDLVALISFNDDVYVITDFTKDNKTITDGVSRLKAGGNRTVLFKGIFTGLELLERQNLPLLRYLVVLSDGKEEGVGFTLDDPINEAKKNGIPIYSLGFASTAGSAYLDNMLRMSKMTGGEYREVKQSVDFSTAYSEIAGKILDQSILQVKADFNSDGRDHLMELVYSASGNEAKSGPVTISLPLKTQNKSMNTITIAAIVIGAIIVGSICVFIFMKKRNAKRLEQDARSAAQAERALRAAQKKDMQISVASGNVAVVPRKKSPFVITVPSLGLEFPLSPGAMTIGANPGNTFVINDETVSGFHAELSGDGRAWFLKDLGSTNGTLLNGLAVKEPAQIRTGDVILFARVEARLIDNRQITR